METRIISFLVMGLIVVSSCMEEQTIRLPSAEPRMVIDGLISDGETAGSSITIGWTAEVNASCTDNFGMLIPCEPTNDQGPYKVQGVITIIEENTGNMVELQLRMDDKRGFTKMEVPITGTPGFTYSLVVDLQYNGMPERYTARTSMIPTPDISDITYEIRKGDIGKSDNLVPLIDFEEPEGENFYLLQLCSNSRDWVYCGNSSVWSYSIIADTFLPKKVKGLSVDDGASIVKYAEFYPSPEPGEGAVVHMYSIDKVTYDFYKSLIDQFNNDGGAFSPTPATPRGNISGNAVGIFRALEESSATVYY